MIKKKSISYLHYAIIQYFIDHGTAPGLPELSSFLDNASEDEVKTLLKELEQIHGVVLHPNSFKIWVAHPFSAAPTNFYVTSASQTWWGNCAWCSLGIAALLESDCTIYTTLGAEKEMVNIDIQKGEVVDSDYVVHFPIPMQRAWDNVIYTCSTMLLFRSSEEVSTWSAKHKIPSGDIVSISQAFALAKAWYGNHLNIEWEKWTVEQASEIFQKVGLTGKIWDLNVSKKTF